MVFPSSLAGCVLYFHVFKCVVLAIDSSSESPLLDLRQKALSSPHCGQSHWQETYSQIHSDIHEGRRAERLLIVAHDGQGANDRLTSIITAFYAALLSDRAICLTTYYGDTQHAYIYIYIYQTYTILLYSDHQCPDISNVTGTARDRAVTVSRHLQSC